MNWEETEKEIRAIPDNGPALEELYKLLEVGEAIALVGDGASAELWPMWEEFLQGLIGYTRQCGKLSQVEAGFIQKEAARTPLETAQQLRHKIGDKLYFEYVQETFGHKISPQTGEAFTATHLSLLQLPIQNYLTLNYDSGLTNARAYLYPRAVTSYYFWDQEEIRNLLETNGFKRLILHAHGRYDRSGSVIFTLDDFRRAYNYAPFVRLLDNLFVLKRLIIIGVELGSPYIKQLLNSISGDYKKSPLKHIAFVGLDDEEMELTALHRERTEMIYGARIIFYPSRDKHAALAAWLNAMAEKYALPAGDKRAEESKPAEAFLPPLSQKQKEDYKQFEYQCYDKVYLPGNLPIRKSNVIEVNGHKIKIGDSLFILLLRFVFELKKEKGGWVSIQDLGLEKIIADAGKYQNYSNLRNKLDVSLLGKDGQKFIQNDGAKRYRISTHPDFVSYNKEKLLSNSDNRVQRMAAELP